MPWDWHLVFSHHCSTNLAVYPLIALSTLSLRFISLHSLSSCYLGRQKGKRVQRPAYIRFRWFHHWKVGKSVDRRTWKSFTFSVFSIIYLYFAMWKCGSISLGYNYYETPTLWKNYVVIYLPKHMRKHNPHLHIKLLFILNLWCDYIPLLSRIHTLTTYAVPFPPPTPSLLPNTILLFILNLWYDYI